MSKRRNHDAGFAHHNGSGDGLGIGRVLPAATQPCVQRLRLGATAPHEPSFPSSLQKPISPRRWCRQVARP